MVQAHSTDRRWSRALQHEHSLRLELQENMVALANQMQGMEDEARKKLHVQGPFAQHPLSATSSSPEVTINTGDTSLPENDTKAVGSKVKSGKKVVLSEETDGYESSDDEDKFFDAPEMSPEEWDKASMATGHKRNVSSVSVNEFQAMMNEEPRSTDILPVSSDRKMSVSNIVVVMQHVKLHVHNESHSNCPPWLVQIPHEACPDLFKPAVPTLTTRRTSVPPKPSSKLNLWTIMKNCIGKDLSKIPLPVSRAVPLHFTLFTDCSSSPQQVNFNEPLSLLQRMMEEIYYSDLLSQAAQTESTLEEISYLAAFVLSAYSHTVFRVGKPFNPLLGETFECDRRAELGWRCFMEQVSPNHLIVHVYM